MSAALPTTTGGPGAVSSPATTATPGVTDSTPPSGCTEAAAAAAVAAVTPAPVKPADPPLAVADGAQPDGLALPVSITPARAPKRAAGGSSTEADGAANTRPLGAPVDVSQFHAPSPEQLEVLSRPGTGGNSGYMPVTPGRILGPADRERAIQLADVWTAVQMKPKPGEQPRMMRFTVWRDETTGKTTWRGILFMKNSRVASNNTEATYARASKDFAAWVPAGNRFVIAACATAAYEGARRDTPVPYVGDNELPGGKKRVKRDAPPDATDATAAVSPDSEYGCTDSDDDDDDDDDGGGVVEADSTRLLAVFPMASKPFAGMRMPPRSRPRVLSDDDDDDAAGAAAAAAAPARPAAHTTPPVKKQRVAKKKIPKNTQPPADAPASGADKDDSAGEDTDEALQRRIKVAQEQLLALQRDATARADAKNAGALITATCERISAEMRATTERIEALHKVSWRFIMVADSDTSTGAAKGLRAYTQYCKDTGKAPQFADDGAFSAMRAECSAVARDVRAMCSEASSTLETMAHRVTADTKTGAGAVARVESTLACIGKVDKLLGGLDDNAARLLNHEQRLKSTIEWYAEVTKTAERLFAPAPAPAEAAPAAAAPAAVVDPAIDAMQWGDVSTVNTELNTPECMDAERAGIFGALSTMHSEAGSLLPPSLSEFFRDPTLITHLDKMRITSATAKTPFVMSLNLLMAFLRRHLIPALEERGVCTADAVYATMSQGAAAAAAAAAAADDTQPPAPPL